MDPQSLILAIADAVEREPLVAAFCLAGSYGRGTEDRFSDLDFAAFVAPDDHAEFASNWRGILTGILPIVFWNQFGSQALVVNAISEDWHRIDLAIHAPDDIARRAKSNIRPLFDRRGLFDALPDGPATPGPDPDRVRFLINEFIRVLGLMPVTDGRGEYFIAVMGTGLLRGFVADLMVEMESSPERGGILHLNRLLPVDKIAVLNALPTPSADRSELIAADAEIARLFFPMARAAADELGIDWPEAFERATQRRLEAHFGDEFDVAWR